PARTAPRGGGRAGNSGPRRSPCPTSRTRRRRRSGGGRVRSGRRGPGRGRRPPAAARGRRSPRRRRPPWPTSPDAKARSSWLLQRASGRGARAGPRPPPLQAEEHVAPPGVEEGAVGQEAGQPVHQGGPPVRVAV